MTLARKNLLSPRRPVELSIDTRSARRELGVRFDHTADNVVTGVTFVDDEPHPDDPDGEPEQEEPTK